MRHDATFFLLLALAPITGVLASGTWSATGMLGASLATLLMLALAWNARYRILPALRRERLELE